jgi:hypothetical protein
MIPAGALSFEDARASVITEYQNELEKNWLDALRKKYPIKVDDKIKNMSLKNLSLSLVGFLVLSGCEFIKMKNEQATDAGNRVTVARVNAVYLYKDELVDILAPATTKQDSIERAETYITSWIRKQAPHPGSRKKN